MTGRMVQVGVREFREDLAQYIDAQVPIAVTRHGRTVGFFIPKRPMLNEQELAAFHRAGEELRALMAEQGVTEDEVVREFQAIRKGRAKNAGA